MIKVNLARPKWFLLLLTKNRKSKLLRKKKLSRIFYWNMYHYLYGWKRLGRKRLV